MEVPSEFSHKFLAAKKVKPSPYMKIVRSSWVKDIVADNPNMRIPDLTKPLEWGPQPQYGYERYWDTTAARKHVYWKDFDLPKATKDIDQLRQDLYKWGFCIIEDALSKEQYRHMKQRVFDQVAGEKAAGVPAKTPTGQYVHGLVNKGECFVKCIEFNPDGVQAGPLLDILMDELLGKGWISDSFLANAADPGGYPQGLHQDQGLFPQLKAPVHYNCAFILEDVNETNGGTLLVPGSHKLFEDAGDGAIGKLPPPINMEAPGGSVALWDGRLLHAAGANRGTGHRYVCTMSCIKPWKRSQENWVLSVKPQVLATASPKLLQRMGFYPFTGGGCVEGYGIGGDGMVGGYWGSLKMFREDVDAGRYQRVEELSPTSPSPELDLPFTIRKAIKAAREGHAAKKEHGQLLTARPQLFSKL